MRSLQVVLLCGIFSSILISGCTQQAPTGQPASGTAGGAAVKTCKQVPYADKECTTTTSTEQQCSDVPYQDCQSVPYTDRECKAEQLKYTVEMTECSSRQSGLLGLGDQPAKVSVKVTNLDTETGVFTVKLGYTLKSTGQSVDALSTASSYTIYPQKAATFTGTLDADINQCTYLPTIPTKQVCENVIKTRQECTTKYRSQCQSVPKTTQQCRDVTKYKEECS